jgi:polyribonucleotide nucleotidyltransferase
LNRLSGCLGNRGRIKVLEVDKQGRIRLSMKAIEEGEGVAVE